MSWCLRCCIDRLLPAVLALALALLSPVSTRAEDECAEGSTAEECLGWGPWANFYSSPGTSLGVKVTATQVVEERGTEAAFLVAYATELRTTLKQVSGHVALFGSLGGGSARTEGSLGGALDFGFRASVTPHSGPFVRAGVDGYLLGNRRLYVSLFEPVQGRMGYQWLDGARMLEAGLTAGYVWAGSFDAGDGERELGDSSEAGGYVSLRLHGVSFDARFAHLIRRGAPGPFDVARLGLCGYPDIVAVCSDVMYLRGDSVVDGWSVRARTAWYAGFSVGLALQ